MLYIISTQLFNIICSSIFIHQMVQRLCCVISGYEYMEK